MVDSQIKLFFQDQTVFLTGASGFVGKLLVEKLLRVCDDVKKIYILMRSKKGKTPQERFDKFFNYPCFDLLKSQNGNFLEKICPIAGDCKNPGLGLSEEDRNFLIDETTCVIHAAANVKFDQTLKEAAHNVRATKDILELSKRMTKLRVFVFISTAFSHCINTYAEEKFYEPPIKADTLLSLVDAFDDDTLQAMTPQFLGKWPNTYVYTKCVSEDLIKDAAQFLPLTVVRPAIVISTAAEPMPGWVDNLNGPMGIMTAAGLGVVRSVHAKVDAVAPLVPVDYVVNCILAAACKRGKCKTTTIYNFVGEDSNQLTWRHLQKHIEIHQWRCAFEKALWYGRFELKERRIWHKMSMFFTLVLPAYIVDFTLFCLKKPTIAVKNCQKLDKMLDLNSYFSTKYWSWNHINVTQLWNEMNDDDKKLFHFTLEDIDWNTYHRNAVDGVRLYLMKETIDSLPRAQRRLKFLFVAHYSVVILFYYLLYKIIISMLKLFF